MTEAELAQVAVEVLTLPRPQGVMMAGVYSTPTPPALPEDEQKLRAAAVAYLTKLLSR